MDYNYSSPLTCFFHTLNEPQNILRPEDPNLEYLRLASDSRRLFNRSGYSSTSPPGTSASSPTSVNSQPYSPSPEDVNMEVLINTLLQVCNNSLSVSTSRNIRFSQAESSSINRCKDCTERPCDACFRLQRLNASDPGNVSERNLMQSLPGALNPAIVNPSLNSLQKPLYCDIHRGGRQLYCQTCCTPICLECEFQLHRSHITINLIETIERAHDQADIVLKETKFGITSLKEELDDVQIAVEILEQRARQAAADLTSCMKRIIAALEAREKELLSRIEKVRTQKYTALQQRDDGIRSGIIRLTRAADKLNHAISNRSYDDNPLNLILTKDMASAEIFEIRQAYQNLPSHDENWISFNSSEANVIAVIANLGNILVNNPGPIGDRRALRGESPPHMLCGSGFSFAFSPPIRGRAIALSGFPITVKLTQKLDVSVKPLKIIGNSSDNTDDNLCRPWGVACDREGHMIVADRSNNRIQVFKPDGSLLRRFGAYGTAPGYFDRPAGVAVDARRRIIIADKDNHRIQIFTMNGTFLLCFGEKGSCCGQFNYPWDVAANAECQIVVSDTRNHRVQLFSAEGIFLRKYGYETTPAMWKHFDSPRGVAFNPEGNIITTDFNNHRLVIIDSDFMNARIFECKSTGGGKQFLRPQGLAIDDDGNIIVADSRNHRIQIFDSSGMLVGRFGSYGKGDEEMDRPSGIAVCPGGKIAVVDFGNNRLLLV